MEFLTIFNNAKISISYLAKEKFITDAGIFLGKILLHITFKYMFVSSILTGKQHQQENFDILFKILKKIKKNLILVFCTLIIVIDTIH